MKVLKLDGVKVITKSEQKQIQGGADKQCFVQCIREGWGDCACMCGWNMPNCW